MRVNDNTVNIKSGTVELRPYHHGDLRTALVNTGMRLLEKSNAEQLSLRAVARDVGVSAAAVYRHFPDKAALLTALAMSGLERLGQEQMAASAAAGSGMDGFIASGRAYVGFALAHPALFRLIMSCGPEADHFAMSETTASDPMRFLRQNVQDLAPPGTPSAAIRAVALRAWSEVHGLAMLMLDGQVPADSSLIDAVIDGRLVWP